MVYIYGGSSCERLNDSIELCDSTDAIIFSICSDDRLPVDINKIESHILESESLNYKIHILGDLIGLPLYQWRVRSYLISELSCYSKNKNIYLCWYDGDKIREEDGFFVNNPLHVDKLVYVKKNVEIMTEVEFNEGTKEINFLDSCGYPKNILLNKSQKEIDYIFSKISEIPALEKIYCPFVDGIEIKNLPRSLKKLDLRGCSNLKLNPQCIPLTLENLNFSACDLTRVPDFLYRLRKLKKLFLYKNRIGSDIFYDIPLSVEVLSLYRNDIKSIKLDAINLKRVNLGANPLENITVSKVREGLTIGLRKVNCKKLDVSNDLNLTFEF